MEMILKYIEKIESEIEKLKIIKKTYYNLNQIIKYEILYYGR